MDRWCQTQHGVVKVVTGGGKTVFACFCMAEFFEKYPEGRVVVVVPTTALLDQWAIDICFATDIKESEVASFSGQEKSDSLKKINIFVINTARNLVEKLFYGKKEKLMLVMDECHRAGAAKNSKSMLGEYTMTLGLSATPEREYDDGFEEKVMPILGPVIYDYSYEEAYKDEVIVNFNLQNIKIQNISTSSSEKIKINGNTPFSESKRAIARATSMSESEKQALRVLWSVKLALMHSKERVIIFHEKIDAINLIVDMLLNEDVNVVAYHSKLSTPHRRDNLRLFRKGQFQVLATCRALDEGANIPEASVAIIAHSTKSTRQRIQRLGRVLRKAPNKEMAVIYTLYIDEEEKRLLVEEESGLLGVANVSWLAGIKK